MLDTVHSGDRLFAELRKHAGQVSRWVLVRGTGAFWDRAEGSDAPGMRDGFERFRAQFPEWRRVRMAKHQYGWTLLSRDPADEALPDDAPPVPVPAEGPGTDLSGLLESLGIVATAECPCRATMSRMNALGVAGCRVNRDELAAKLAESSQRYGWGVRFGAAARAVSQGLTARLAAATLAGDLYGELVDIALERAVAKLSGGEQRRVA